MLNEQPKWTFASRRRILPGHWRLLPDHVLAGGYICLDRGTGSRRWKNSVRRAKRICGVDSGVILAGEERRDGHYFYARGCYAVRLEDGRLLWKRHGSGRSWPIGRLLESLPFQTNLFADAPLKVEDGRVHCYSGAVLNVQTGELEAPPSRPRLPHPNPDNWWMRILSVWPKRVDSGTGIIITHGQSSEQTLTWGVTAETAEGELLWRLSKDELGKEVDWFFKPCQVSPPFVYLMATEENRFAHGVKNPLHWHLLTVDLRNGHVLQKVPIGNEALSLVLIEDVDEKGLLVSLHAADKQLLYFERCS